MMNHKDEEKANVYKNWCIFILNFIKPLIQNINKLKYIFLVFIIGHQKGELLICS